ncbi:MAG: hypothetical protein MK213_05680, partial [Planctomycetes bacterium]|nr:hypothetical protein [Planctomycetota bacterium]
NVHFVASISPLSHTDTGYGFSVMLGHPYMYLGSAVSDANNSASLQFSVHSKASGVRVWSQAVGHMNGNFALSRTICYEIQ